MNQAASRDYQSLPCMVPSTVLEVCSLSFHLSCRLDGLWIDVLKHEFKNQIAKD